MRKLIIIALAFISFVSYGQQTIPVSGKIYSKTTKKALQSGTVFILTSDSSIAGGAVSEADGSFTVRVNRGFYTIKISYLGMETYVEEIRVYRDLYLGKVNLVDKSSEIGAVTIKGKAPQATVEGDTTSFSAKEYKTTQNASAKDLIEKMPGMQNNNGEIKAQGEKVQQVLVDGKSFFGQDPNAALSTLPAEVVNKIQVFDDKSDETKASGIDDGTRIKTINVVTKINMRNGEFGRLYAGAGQGEDVVYSTGFNLNMFRGEQRVSVLAQTNNINIQNFSTEDLLGVVGDNSKKRGFGGKSRGGSRHGGSAADNFMVNPSNGITTTLAGGVNYQDNWGKKIEVTSSYFYNQGETEAITYTFQNIYLRSADQQYNEIDSTNSTNINHNLMHV